MTGTEWNGDKGFSAWDLTVLELSDEECVRLRKEWEDGSRIGDLTRRNNYSLATVCVAIAQ